MDVTDALDRIGLIHEQLAKAEVYRGYHPVAVGLSGLGGLAAAALQPWQVAPCIAAAFGRSWIAAGMRRGLGVVGATLLRHLAPEDESARRRTRTVVGQFLPCFVAVGAVPAALGPPGLVELGAP